MTARTVVWFSAGAASAVAAKLTLAEHPDAVIAYTDPGSEHADNIRFLADCEQWFGQPIIRLRSDRYRDTWQVSSVRRLVPGAAVEGGVMAYIEDGVHRGSLVDLVYPDGRRMLGRFDDRMASGPAVVALRRSSLADNGYRRVGPGCRVELARVRP